MGLELWTQTVQDLIACPSASCMTLGKLLPFSQLVPCQVGRVIVAAIWDYHDDCVPGLYKYYAFYFLS